jgi:pimeloyl-ACP methyl ester carboxylesterase
MGISEYHPFKSAELKDKFLKDYAQRAENWPVPSETKMVDTSYGKTFVRICGPTGGKPLVLLHGLGVNSLMWALNVEHISAHFRVYAIDDIYGNGRSVYTHTIKASNDYVNWLNELFNALKLGNDIDMMGVSYGGWQISQYALQFSNRLNKIVLIAPAATVLRMRLGFFVRIILMRLFPFRYITRSFLFWNCEDGVKKDKTAVERLIDGIFLAKQCFKYKPVTPIPTVLNDNEWKRIKAPTLFMVGENEKMYSAHSAVRRLNSLALQIKTEIIPNAGHDLLFAQTEMVNKKVLEFLTES